ncbi:MAG: hypothetical protein AAGF11_26265 [Myxococcota bacterium]
MGAPRPRWPALVLLLTLGPLTTVGCDRLTGSPQVSEQDAGEHDPRTPAPPAEAEGTPAPKTVADPVADLVADPVVDPVADPVAETKAKEAAAMAKRTAQQAAAQAEAKQAATDKAAKAEAEAQSRPVNLSNVAVNSTGGLFGRSGAIEVTARAKVNHALGNSTYVHVKSLCKKDDKLVADVGYLNAHYSKPLEQYAAGEEADVKGTLYSQGLESSLSPCQLEFRVGGISGGLSVPVGHACWSGSEVAHGECEPPLVPVAMSGAALPVEVHDLTITPSGGLGTSKGLNLSYLLQINTAQDSNARLTFKSACRIDGKAFVDMGQANLMAGPFKYESGEAVARAANLYWSSSFELAAAPDDCDLTASLWKTKAGTFGEYEEIRINDSCFQGGKLRDGRCDPSAPAPAPASPLAAESVKVDGVQLELHEPHGVAGKFQLKIQADVTVLSPVNQNDGATAKVSCKAGKDTRVESAYLFGPELYYLQAGETARMTANAFGSHPLEVKPRRCTVEFFGGPRFSPSGADGVDLGKFCLNKDKVKKGTKC